MPFHISKRLIRFCLITISIFVCISAFSQFISNSDYDANSIAPITDYNAKMAFDYNNLVSQNNKPKEKPKEKQAQKINNNNGNNNKKTNNKKTTFQDTTNLRDKAAKKAKDTTTNNNNNINDDELPTDESSEEYLQMVQQQKEDEEYRKNLAEAISESNAISEKIDEKDYFRTYLKPSFANNGRRPSAVILSVVSPEDDLQKILDTIYSVETKFNNHLHYPWVFISKETLPGPTISTIESILGNRCSFGTIPDKEWGYPSYIDKNKAAISRAQMFKLEFGSSESYRHMARYLSGPIFSHELLLDYDWYWRIDPGSFLTCDVQYDLFRRLQDERKIFGFTLTGREDPETMKTLWDVTREYIEQHENYTPDLRGFIIDSGDPKIGRDKKLVKADDFNYCYFWSNSEIGNLNFWRSPPVKAYFEYLDHKGGFFYERWSDRMVHTLTTMLFADKDHFQFFKEVGFHFGDFNNCPIEDFLWKENNCMCDQGDDNTFRKRSCMIRFYEAFSSGKPEGYEDHDY